MESNQFTYHTRFYVDASSQAVLGAYASLMSCIERKLFADICKGKKHQNLKSTYITEFGITARQFNSIRIGLEGKIDSVKNLRKTRIIELGHQIAALKERIPKIKKAEQANKIHQKKRRLFNLQRKLDQLKQDEASGTVRICFGSKKLFRAQFSLAENGYSSHEEWKKNWEYKRNNAFFLIGSKDESSGNQSCTATVAEDGSITLRLRLPQALVGAYGKYLYITNVRFGYGHDVIVANILKCITKGEKAGVAINYRFQRDEKGWRVFVTTPYTPPECITHTDRGVIGVDINSDHIAITETDRFGNLINSKSIPLVCYGKTTNETKALVGDVAKEIVNQACAAQKPIVMEKLDFQKKKMTLRETRSTKFSRMLSSLAYSTIIAALKSRSLRFGVEVYEVNPAYTSIIGRVNYAARYGLTIHAAAALIIARRAIGLSERLPRHQGKIPDGKGGYVTLSLPVRNRDKHVWSSWRQVLRQFQVVLAAHFQAKKKILKPVQTCLCDGASPLNLVGAIPTHESLVKLLD